jgi:hypothetical protein
MCLGGLSPGQQSDFARSNIAELGDGWLPFHRQRVEPRFPTPAVQPYRPTTCRPEPETPSVGPESPQML